MEHCILIMVMILLYVIRGVRVRGRYLQGDLYLDGEYIDYIELQMQ